MDIKELKKKIEGIDITYDYYKTYADLYNACIDYQNESQEWEFEELFNDFLDYKTAEEMAKNELEKGGLIRLYYFMGDCNFNNEMFRVNAYGNLEDININDLKYLKDEILERINDIINEKKKENKERV